MPNEGECPDCGIIRAYGDDWKGDFSDPSKCVSVYYNYYALAKQRCWYLVSTAAAGGRFRLHSQNHDCNERDWLLIIFYLCVRSSDFIDIRRFSDLHHFVFQRVSSSCSVIFYPPDQCWQLIFFLLQKLKYRVLISTSLRFRKYVRLCFSLFAHTYPVARFSVLLTATSVLADTWICGISSKLLPNRTNLNHEIMDQGVRILFSPLGLAHEDQCLGWYLICGHLRNCSQIVKIWTTKQSNRTYVSIFAQLVLVMTTIITLAIWHIFETASKLFSYDPQSINQAVCISSFISWSFSRRPVSLLIFAYCMEPHFKTSVSVYPLYFPSVFQVRLKTVSKTWIIRLMFV